MGVTIWHNPHCATSRNALALIRATGTEPEIVEYLNAPPSRAEIVEVAAAVGGPRALLRIKGAPAADLGLTADGVSDDAILDAMSCQSILINRPVVFGPRGIVLARPSEQVLGVLDRALSDEFIKEDGERVLPE